MAKDKSGNEEGKVVKIVWNWDIPQETIYANQVRVTHGGQQEFYIHFGELPYPAVIRGEEIPDELWVTPKARIVVTPEKMEEIVRVLSENLETYKENKG